MAINIKLTQRVNPVNAQKNPMETVKYTSSKWFLENNGEWIEIDEKDWGKVKWMVWSNITTYESFKSWQPTGMIDLYSLPDDVGFEIEETYKMKKVAHLKIEQKPTEKMN